MRQKLFVSYQVMSYVTGVILVVLVFIGMPLKYGFDHPEVNAVVGTAHGFLFMVYVVLVVALGFIAQWPVLKILGVALAGTVPLAVFFVEPRVRRTEQTERAMVADGQPTGGDASL